MVQQKRKIQKLFPERKSWFQLETKNALPNAMGNGCQVLSWNSINKFVFAAAVRELLEKSHKKRLNIFLVGPSSCGKSFLLKPL